MLRRVAFMLAVALSACAPADHDPGISERRAIIPEDRSACELLSRADLGVVAEDTASMGRTAAVIEDVAAFVPAAVRPIFTRAADVHQRAADGILPPRELRQHPAHVALLEWQGFNCGHSL